MEASGEAASPDHIAAAVGPCIAQSSYEVGPDLRDAVLAAGPEDTLFFAPGQRDGKFQFDLAGYCVARLRRAGIGTVADVGADTLADEPRFFSHRRRTLGAGGPIGHQISAIALV